jgi:hypothetical protein
MARQAAPFIIAVLGGAPVVAARLADRAHKPTGGIAVNAAVFASIVGVGVLLLAEHQIAARSKP